MDEAQERTDSYLQLKDQDPKMSRGTAPWCGFPDMARSSCLVLQMAISNGSRDAHSKQRSWDTGHSNVQEMDSRNDVG